MKYFTRLMVGLFLFLSGECIASSSDSTIHFHLPDSVKAVQFLAELNVDQTPGKEAAVGIKTGLVELVLESDKKEKAVIFGFPGSAKIVATGLNTETEKGEIEWKHDWSRQQNYKLLLSSAADSAGNFVLYSGYIWLPVENKWKLIGTCRIEGERGTITEPAIFFSAKNKKDLGQVRVKYSSVWVQRNNGTWKAVESVAPSPVINLYPHIDSLAQANIEKTIIEKAIVADNTPLKNTTDGIYYAILKEGTGPQVNLTDTVTVKYRLHMLNDTATIDEAKDEPATFPLKRLIKGWQLGVPLVKVGGKIRLVIPSGLAYSIRTRAPKIPPNSILVFDIEVLDAKAGQ